MQRRSDAPDQFVLARHGDAQPSQRVLDRAGDAGFRVGQRAVEIKIDCSHQGGTGVDTVVLLVGWAFKSRSDLSGIVVAMRIAPVLAVLCHALAAWPAFGQEAPNRFVHPSVEELARPPEKPDARESDT